MASIVTADRRLESLNNLKNTRGDGSKTVKETK